MKILTKEAFEDYYKNLLEFKRLIIANEQIIIQTELPVLRIILELFWVGTLLAGQK